MCFSADKPEIKDPPPPPEVLKQDAPEKKTAQRSKSSVLSIGSKKYRTESGLGPTTTNNQSTAGGPTVAI